MDNTIQHLSPEGFWRVNLLLPFSPGKNKPRTNWTKSTKLQIISTQSLFKRENPSSPEAPRTGHRLLPFATLCLCLPTCLGPSSSAAMKGTEILTSQGDEIHWLNRFCSWCFHVVSVVSCDFCKSVCNLRVSIGDLGAFRVYNSLGRFGVFGGVSWSRLLLRFSGSLWRVVVRRRILIQRSLKYFKMFAAGQVNISVTTHYQLPTVGILNHYESHQILWPLATPSYTRPPG